LHPFMPFLTEELWHQLPQREGACSIALDTFPGSRTDWIDHDAEFIVGEAQGSITNQRDVKSKFKIQSAASVTAYTSTSAAVRPMFESNLATFQRLTGFGQKLVEEPPTGANIFTERSGRDFQVYFVQELTPANNGAEIEKLRKDVDRLTKDIASKQSRLADETFRSRAPEHIVTGLEATLAEREAELAKLKERLATLEKNI